MKKVILQFVTESQKPLKYTFLYVNLSLSADKDFQIYWKMMDGGFCQKFPNSKAIVEVLDKGIKFIETVSLFLLILPSFIISFIGLSKEQWIRCKKYYKDNRKCIKHYQHTPYLYLHGKKKMSFIKY